jgi:hypothetical protein
LWRDQVLELLTAMGYRSPVSITADTWRARLGFGSAETAVFVQLEARPDELTAEAVLAHRQSLIAEGCQAGVLICRGLASAAAIAEGRRIGVPLVTLVDRAVVTRAISKRPRRRS